MLDLLILTFNEEERLPAALSVAKKWAKNIYIFDKSSTDRTAELAEQAGCIVVNMPFSRQGHEDYLWIDQKIKELKSNDESKWILCLTPGEIPTRELIEVAKKIAFENPNHDAVCLPVRLHSFGRFLPGSPWSLSFQPRLLNLSLVQQRNVVHSNIVLTDKSVKVSDSEVCHIYHPTHRDFDSFLKSHIDYVYAETQGEPLTRAKRAIQSAESYDPEVLSRTDGDPRQFLAWKAFHYLVALRGYDQLLANQTKEFYISKAKFYVDREWCDSLEMSLVQ